MTPAALLKRLWRILPRRLRYAALRIAGPTAWNLYAHQNLARPRPNVDLSAGPLVIAGLFRSANGLGEAVRATYRSATAVGLKPIAVDLSAYLAPTDVEPDIPLSPMPNDEVGTLILQVNGPEITASLHHLGMFRGRHWRTIGYWAWELAEFPKPWAKSLPFLSDIWTVSEFSAKALSKRSMPFDVEVIHHAVHAPRRLTCDRASFALEEEAFVSLTMADSLSSFARKNPYGAIAAHQKAFGDDPKRILLVKVRNLSRHEDAKASLEAAIEGFANIRIIDDTLPSDERWTLIASADVLISLHRSEGFGLTIAEAMSAGTAVIATDYSGNTDFANTSNALTVPYRLVPVEDPSGIYHSKTAKWAEPDIETAANHLLQLAEATKPTTTLQENALATIQQKLSHEHIGRTILDVLNKKQTS